MSGNRYIAVLPGIGRTGHVPDSPVQAQIVGPFQNRDLDVNLGYPENAEGRREVCGQTLLVILDTFLRPQTEVRNRTGQRYRLRLSHRSQALRLESLQFRTRKNNMMDLGCQIKGEHQHTEDK